MKLGLNTIKKAAVAVLLAVCSACAYAQDAANMSTTELKDEAVNLANAHRYLEARPYIVELIKRIESSEDKALRALLQQFYFFEAYSYRRNTTRAAMPTPRSSKRRLPVSTR